MCCEKCEKAQLLINCQECKLNFCSNCAKPQHLEDHYKFCGIICQQCEEIQSKKYCSNCQQYLCLNCSEKIHNKAKRAKHTLQPFNPELFLVQQCFIICADLLQDIEHKVPAIVKQIQEYNDSKYKLILSEDQKLQVGDKFFTLNFTSSEMNNQFLANLMCMYPMIRQLILVDSPFLRNCQTKIRMNCPLRSIKTIKLQGLVRDNSELLRHNISVNLSTSTQNSMRKRSKKSPIPYFQSWLSSKNEQKLRIIQEKYRNWANQGIIMLRQDSERQSQFNKTILRKFIRNVGETQLQYVSMQIQTITIQSLYWVILSIKNDKMTPTDKLILSRFKQSFDLKINTKLWQSIIKYLQDNQYIYDRMQKDSKGQIPHISVEQRGEDLVFLLQGVVWQYQDQGQLEQNSIQWKQFVDLLQDYFINNTQIGGGRYGCVQYVKLFAMKPLCQCSLGKLSLFVQEAINKGIIRYHKTVLVSNNQSQSFINNQSISYEMDATLKQLQRQIKILMVQLSLVDMLLECGQGIQISLAQIPLNLKKSIPFELNLIELGFPKLKNLLNTITDKINLKLTKSHLNFQIHQYTYEVMHQQKNMLINMQNAFLSGIMNYICDIMSYCENIVLEGLKQRLNMRLGFIFDEKIFSMTDFYHFIGFYCSSIVYVQITMGVFVVYGRQQNQKIWANIPNQNPQTITPKFNSSLSFDCKKIQTFHWSGYDDLDIQQSDDLPCQEEQYESQSFTDYKNIQKIIDDDDKSISHPKTVIEKSGSLSHTPNQLCISKITPIENKQDLESKSFGIDELDLIQNEASIGDVKSPRAHNRVYSNTPFQSKLQHIRGHSTISRDQSR